ncbi:uncharacterized protein LOC126815146 [Patella vulgata]|uniref:uncharacterized protein LOC126815146 n=1 Tax=Patella vulgata TaxID=6465 RepID=UPI0024A7F132|nr:uncharacterized protein LOC126815146 [Patella vulgata]
MEYSCLLFFWFWILINLESKSYIYVNANLHPNDQNVEEPDYENLVYGEVWKKEVTKLSMFSKDTNTAYRYVMKFLDNSGYIRQMEVEGVLIYRVSDVKKKIIQYSRSGHAPLYALISVPYGRNKKTSTISVPVTFGSFFTFSIEWRTEHFSQYHQITVSNSWNLKFYIFSHTFHRIYYHPLNRTSTCVHFVDDLESKNSVKNRQKSDMSNSTLSTEQILHTSELTQTSTSEDDEAESDKPIVKKSTRKKLHLEVLKDQVNPVNPDLYLDPDQVLDDQISTKTEERPIKKELHEEVTLKTDVSSVTIKMRKIEKPVEHENDESKETHKIKENKIGEEVFEKSDLTEENCGKKDSLKDLTTQEKLEVIRNTKKLIQTNKERLSDADSDSELNDENLSPTPDNQVTPEDNNNDDSYKEPEVILYTDDSGREFEAVVYGHMIEIRGVSDSCMRPNAMMHDISRKPIELLFPEKSSGGFYVDHDKSISIKTWKDFLYSLWTCSKQTEIPGKGCCDISIISFNIWFFHPLTDDSDDYVKRIQRAGKILSESNADVIGLQEVRFEEGKGGELGPNQIDYFTSILPSYQFVYQPAMFMDNSLYNGRTEEGLAIMTKYEIINHDYILLYRNMSNSADRHQRICLHVEINVPGVGSVHVFNTHLSLSHEAREKSVEQIWKYMSKFTGPSILLGDFNAEPEEKSIRYLQSQPQLVDIWTYIHGDNDSGKTFKSIKENRLLKRIDYIFHRKQENTKILDIELLDTDTWGSLSASDHVAVLSKLGLNCPQKE